MQLEDMLVDRTWVPREVDEAARGAVEALAPRIADVARSEGDEGQRLVRFVRLLGEAGLLRLTVPATHGGRFAQRSVTAMCLARRALAWQDPLADFAFALQGLAAAPLVAFGGPRFADHVARLVRGEAVGAYALTEARAGTDVTGIETLARREGEGWVLDGHKRYVSNAGLADFYVVFAVTDPAAPPRRRLSAFVVPAESPGLRVQRLEVLSDHPVGALRLREVRLPSEALLGEEGRGLTIALATIQGKRATVGAAAIGMAERALHETVRHVRRRRQFGAPLAELQLVQAHLGTMLTELQAAWLLVLRAAVLQDAGADRATVTAAGSMAKLQATEAAFRVVDQAVQLHGGQGLLEGSLVARLYRRIRPLRIYEGTNDVQRLLVARELLKGVGADEPADEPAPATAASRSG